MKKIIVNGYDITKQNLHGLSPEQYIQLMEFQKFKHHPMIKKILKGNAKR